MNADCIGCNNQVVFRLPRPVAAPRGWQVHEVHGVVGDHYRIAGPPGNPRQLYYYLPWLPVRETREEAERDALPGPGDGTNVYGAVTEFPLGGYVWFQTGLQPRSSAEDKARKAMAQMQEELGLSTCLSA